MNHKIKRVVLSFGFVVLGITLGFYQNCGPSGSGGGLSVGSSEDAPQKIDDGGMISPGGGGVACAQGQANCCFAHAAFENPITTSIGSTNPGAPPKIAEPYAFIAASSGACCAAVKAYYAASLSSAGGPAKRWYSGNAGAATSVPLMFGPSTILTTGGTPARLQVRSDVSPNVDGSNNCL